jgi:hypothetical protein
VRITPRSVHNKRTRVLADGLGESFWSFLDDNVPPAIFTGECSFEGRPIRVLSVREFGDDNLLLETGFTLNKILVDES